jgi:hypothetical protein
LIASPYISEMGRIICFDFVYKSVANKVYLYGCTAHAGQNGPSPPLYWVYDMFRHIRVASLDFGSFIYKAFTNTKNRRRDET